MALKRIIVPALALFLGVAGLTSLRASSLSQVSANVQIGGGWDVPPQDLQETQRQGFHDGIEGARKDFGNHRQPNVNNRDEYRDPQLPREQREAYREGFRRGYDVGVSHLMGGNQQPMGGPGQPMGGPMMGGQDRGGPDMRPDMGMDQGVGSDIQRRGFRDGMEGARKDLGNRRQPNVNNRDEYRHPSVPRGLRSEYREGFRRGYDRGIAQMMGNRDRDHDHNHY